MFDLELVRTLLQPFLELFSTILVSGVTTSIVVQIFKSNVIPVPVSKYPRVTTAFVSVIASFVAIYLSGIDLVLQSPLQYLAFFIGVVITSSITYNNYLKGTTTNDGQSKEALDI